jgi:hypothetical protein
MYVPVDCFSFKVTRDKSPCDSSSRHYRDKKNGYKIVSGNTEGKRCLQKRRFQWYLRVYKNSVMQRYVRLGVP